MSNIIKASVFRKRGAPSRDLLESLVVRGGSTKVGETLKDKFKWDGTSPTACPLFSLNTTDGRVKAARWTIHGRLARRIKFRAEDVFEGADKDLIVTVEIEDLGVFEFGGAGGNFSHWVEGRDLSCVVTNRLTKERLSGGEVEDKGLTTFCCRAVLVPETPSSALLWIAVVPVSLESLKEMLPSVYTKNNCPQIALGLGAGGVRPVRVNMAVEEGQKDGCGFGCFPLLEWLDSEMVAFPDPEELRKGVHSFMRATRGMNNRGVKTFRQTVDDAAELAKVGQLPHVWPEAPVPMEDEGDDDGWSCLIYSSV